MNYIGSHPTTEISEKINNCIGYLPKEQAELLKLSYFYENAF